MSKEEDSSEHYLFPLPYESETQNAIITYKYRDYWPPVNISLK